MYQNDVTTRQKLYCYWCVLYTGVRFVEFYGLLTFKMNELETNALGFNLTWPNIKWIANWIFISCCKQCKLLSFSSSRFTLLNYLLLMSVCLSSSLVKGIDFGSLFIMKFWNINVHSGGKNSIRPTKYILWVKGQKLFSLKSVEKCLKHELRSNLCEASHLTFWITRN